MAFKGRRLHGWPKRKVGGQRHPEDLYQKNLLVKNELVVNDRKVEKVDSTQRVADELRQTGVPQGTVVLAKEQTMSRGRHSREWRSPEGGHRMSLALRLTRTTGI